MLVNDSKKMLFFILTIIYDLLKELAVLKPNMFLYMYHDYERVILFSTVQKILHFLVMLAYYILFLLDIKMYLFFIL